MESGGSFHDVVIFQFPLFWYSTPPILKQWQDIVLEYGWAYGEGGTKSAISYLDVIDNFVNTEPYCVRHKVQIPEHLAKSLFLLLDIDESGEIEPSEILIFDRRIIGQSREAKAGADAKKQFDQFIKHFKPWISEITGLC